MEKFRFDYSENSDILHIHKNEKTTKGSVELGYFTLDLGENKEIIGLEIEHASEFLNKSGILTQIHYPIPIHLQVPYLQTGYKIHDFPVTEKLSRQLLSLPMFPELTEDEIIYITRAIKDFYLSY
jgi:dTDP-4-amino-4,6-dideoxygalactose transaminase